MVETPNARRRPGPGDGEADARQGKKQATHARGRGAGRRRSRVGWRWRQGALDLETADDGPAALDCYYLDYADALLPCWPVRAFHLVRSLISASHWVWVGLGGFGLSPFDLPSLAVY